MKRLFPRICLCGSLIISFLFLPVNSVYASTNPQYQDHTYWNWWYVEQSTGVSAEDIQTTDAGIPTGEYIANNGGGTRQNAYDWIKEKYDNATVATSNSIEYYYNAVDDIYNRSVDYAEKGFYAAENAVRKTVDKAGKAVYDVSSSDFWSGFYNSMYNGNGSKTIYNDGASSTTGNVNGNNISISYAGIVYEGEQIAVSQAVYDTVNTVVNFQATATNIFDSSTPIHQTANGGYCYLCFNLSVNGVNCLIANARYLTSNLLFISGQLVEYRYDYILQYNVYAGYDRTETKYIVFRNNLEDIGTSTEQIPQPSQMGFIIDPLTGDRVPVYTDPSQNPFTINPNGTVTMDGNDYPIYVDPDDISDDGWLWLLRYLQNQNQTDPSQNPWGLPWNTQPDGTSQGGFFSNLIKDIGSLFSGLGDILKGLIDKIIKALSGIIDFIVDGLKKFFTAFLDFDTDIFDDIEIDNNFGVITELYHTLLEILGVE